MFPCRTVELPLEATLIPAEEGNIEALRCLRCGGSLDVHQPDIQELGRLLATCQEQCAESGSWYTLDLCSDGPSAVLILLPTSDVIRAACKVATDRQRGSPANGSTPAREGGRTGRDDSAVSSSFSTSAPDRGP